MHILQESYKEIHDSFKIFSEIRQVLVTKIVSQTYHYFREEIPIFHDNFQLGFAYLFTKSLAMQIYSMTYIIIYVIYYCEIFLCQFMKNTKIPGRIVPQRSLWFHGQLTSTSFTLRTLHKNHMGVNV